jgi:hypothetical protein
VANGTLGLGAFFGSGRRPWPNLMRLTFGRRRHARQDSCMLSSSIEWKMYPSTIDGNDGELVDILYYRVSDPLLPAKLYGKSTMPSSIQFSGSNTS